MTSDREELIQVARAIAAGLAVDWTTVESSASNESLREAIRELKVISEIAELHHSLPGPASSSSGAPSQSGSPASSPADTVAAVESEGAVDTWGPLTLLERVGRGSFGEVYRAWDSRLAREVALKLLRRPDGPHDSVGSSVIDEGRLLARVRHPNVITVYGADRIDGSVGLWMEFVQGRTLERVLRDHGPLGAHEAALIGLDLCRALSAVHRSELIHRDVKAQNVMREAGGRIVLMDFGAGRDRQDGGDERASDLAGTPLYLAPELFERAEAGARTDIYSLGVLLYHLVTSSYPVKGATFRDVREAHRQGRRTLLRDERPDLPDKFVQVVERATDPDSGGRFETAGAMEVALTTALTTADAATTPLPGELAEDRPPQAISPPVLRFRRHVVLLAGLIVIAAFFPVVLNVGGWRDRLIGRPGQPSQPGVPDAQAAAGEPSLVVRHVLLPEPWFVGKPSLDGRYLPFVDANQDLALKELETGEIRPLTNKGKSAEFAHGPSAISPDGKWVAYNWETLDRASELRVIGIDGAWPRVVLRHRDVQLYVVEWSGDGREILTMGPHRNGTVRIALVSALDGTVRPLRDLGARPMGVSLSPDGRFVVYDRPQPNNPRRRDIFILATDGSGEWPLVEHPANDLFPQWTPDGGRVVFASDRTGALGLWAVEMGDRNPVGEPGMINRDMGRMFPIGLTNTGAFYYFLKTGLIDVYTASVDPATGGSGKPQPVAPNYVGSNVTSDWSPDGRYLAYVSIRSAVSADRFSRSLSIRDLGTGDERDLWPALGFFVGPRWSPDGRSILVSGLDLKGGSGIHRVDVGTGAVQPAVLFDPTKSRGSEDTIGEYQWAPDSRAVVYRKGTHAIVWHDLATGAERMILDVRTLGVDRLTRRAERPTGPSSFQLSPDGRTLAFSGWTGKDESAEASLIVWPLGGAPVALLNSRDGLLFQGWTPDGLELLFTRPSRNEGRPPILVLWRMSASGGEPRRVGLEMPGLGTVRLGPDGTRLTFTAGAETGEVRVMENFVPGR